MLATVPSQYTVYANYLTGNFKKKIEPKNSPLNLGNNCLKLLPRYASNVKFVPYKIFDLYI